MENDIYSELLSEKIDASNDGDVHAARWLLSEFCDAVEQFTDSDGKPHRLPPGTNASIPFELLRYLSSRLRDVLDGVPADKALGTRPGQPGAPHKGREAIMQRNVQLCLHISKLRRDGLAVSDAIKRTAAKHGVSKSTVTKAWEGQDAKLSAELIERLHKQPKK